MDVLRCVGLYIFVQFLISYVQPLAQGDLNSKVKCVFVSQRVQVSVYGLCGTVHLFYCPMYLLRACWLWGKLKLYFFTKNKYNQVIDRKYEGKKTRHYIIYSVKQLMLYYVQVYIIIFYNFMIYYLYSKLTLKSSYVLYFIYIFYFSYNFLISQPNLITNKVFFFPVGSSCRY